MCESYLSPGISSASDEKELWRSLLPTDEDEATLSKRYPAMHQGGLAWRPTMDRLEEPFGLLTARGLESARRVGGGRVVTSTNYGRTMLTARAAMDRSCEHGTHLVVRDTLNGFDTHPKESYKAIDRVRRQFKFAEDEPELRAALIHNICGANRDNFGWLLAVDYAEARSAHDIPTYGDDLLIPAKSYLQRRYRHYMADPQLRRFVALPIIQNLRDALASAIDVQGENPITNVAHDVTILALLLSIDAELPSESWMPPFTCDFTLDLSTDSTISLSLDGMPLKVRSKSFPHHQTISAQHFLQHLDEKRSAFAASPRNIDSDT